MAAFTLNVSVLGGSEYDYVESIIEDRGRSITLEYSQSGPSQDMEIYGYAVRFLRAESLALESA